MLRILLASAASRKALPMAKSIKSILGAEVLAVFHVKHPYLHSRYFDRRLLLPLQRTSRDWAIAVLHAALSMDCDAVLPVDFVDVATLAKQGELFESAGVTLLAPSSESVELAADKGRLPELLSGVARVPKQVVFDGGPALPDLAPPLVVKGLGDASNPSYHLSLESALEEAERRGRCLIQEYVPGVGRGYYAVAYEGTLLLEFTHERLVERDPSGGASMAARGPVLDPRLYEIGRTVVRKLEWTGPLMVETRFNAEEGYYVVELNPKFWGSLDLPVSLGYHFPAVLVAAFLEGPERARRLAESLSARSGGFSWVLDGFRYLAKIPATWLKLAKLAAERDFECDIDAKDPARAAAQLTVALSKLHAEKRRWMEQLATSDAELKSWVRTFLSALTKREKVLALDFDGVIVELGVNWRSVRADLSRRGLARNWESVTEALVRLWQNDREAYWRASDVVGHHERASLKRLRTLIPPELLSRVGKLYSLYVVTAQPAEVALEALELAGVREVVRGVLGRDSGFGPLKKAMLSEVMKRHGNAGVIMVDDRLENLVKALRLGAAPLHASDNLYRSAQASRLGIPSAPSHKLARFLASVAKGARDWTA